MQNASAGVCLCFSALFTWSEDADGAATPHVTAVFHSHGHTQLFVSLVDIVAVRTLFLRINVEFPAELRVAATNSRGGKL